MADHSPIEWTDDTWNPIRGCSRVSAGCQHCYAEAVANRFSKPGLPYAGLIHPITKGWNGQVELVEHLLEAPLRKKKPRLIFVNSMSDLFHESVPNEFIAAIFGVMAATPQHTYQVLTKRPERMLAWFNWHAAEVKKRDFHGQRKWQVCEDEAAEHIANLPAIGCQSGWPLRNVWLGVSVENQAAADERIPLLLQTPAAVRWLSCEPLLGPVDLTSIEWPDKDGHRVDILRGGYWVAKGHSMCGSSAALGAERGYFTNHSDMETIDWVVVGGESGPQARPMHPDWGRALRDQCADHGANVPFFFKQFGKRKAGRLLDGVEHNAYPEISR